MFQNKYSKPVSDMRVCLSHTSNTHTLKSVMLCDTLEVQHISLIECIESCGAPISSTGMPRREARMGPMVVPQGLSLRTITSCRRKDQTVSKPSTISSFFLYSDVYFSLILSSNSFMLELLVYLLVFLFFFTVSLIMFLFTSVVENFESCIWIHKWKH